MNAELKDKQAGTLRGPVPQWAKEVLKIDDAKMVIEEPPTARQAEFLASHGLYCLAKSEASAAIRALKKKEKFKRKLETLGG